MHNVERIVIGNENVKLLLTKILNPSNIEPKDESGREILSIGKYYTVVDSHEGTISGTVMGKTDFYYAMRERGNLVGPSTTKLDYHDLNFVIETQKI